MRLLIITYLMFFLCGVVKADHPSPNIDTGGAGTVFTTGGKTLPKGKFAVGTAVQFIEQDDLSTEVLEAAGAVGNEVHSTDSLLNVAINGAYGITDDLTVGFSIPYVKRSNVFEGEEDNGVGEAEFAGDSEGLSDASFFAQYRFFKDSVQDASFILGIKAPTGDTDELELEGSLFEIEQQPGTGAWDPFLGTSYSRAFGNFGFSANLLYRFSNGGDQQTTPGDIFNYNFAASYRQKFGGHDANGAHSHPLGIIEYVDYILELNGDYRERFEIAGEEDNNTGGNTIYLGPAVRVGIGHQFSVYTAAQAAVLNDLNGIQSEPDYRILGGFSFLF